MSTPSGIRLKDGFPTFISFALINNIGFWEISVKPFGMDAGGPNDTTTMRNTRLRTRQPKKLITSTSMTGKCAYDPQVKTQLFSILGINGEMTITYPDGSTETAWGWLDKFEPDEIVEGAQPTASFTIEASNENNAGTETAPTQTSATTTTTTTTTTTP